MKSMLKTTISAVAGIAAVAGMTLGAAPALAEYPEKPVEFIVPFPPGDAEDVLTRLIAEEMQKQSGVPAAVVNKPGGGGGPFPGAAYVKEQGTDGSTIGSFVIGVPISGDIFGIEGITLDTFEPIGIFLTYPFVLAAKGDAPYSNLEELSAYAKKNDVVLGHFGHVLTPTKITMTIAKNKGFEYAGDSAFDMLDCNTLASGDADLINTTLPLILPCVNDLKIIAAVTDDRISILPNVPTVGEQMPELNLALWNGLFVKKGTPQEVKDKIAGYAQKALQSEAAKEFGKNTGTLIYWQGEEEAKKRIMKDHGTMKTVLKTLGEL